MTRGWRTAEIIRETAENVRSTPVRSGLHAAAAAIVGALLIIVSASTLADIADRDEANRAAGADVVRVVFGAGSWPASRCDAAAALDGVVNAGGVIRSTPITIVTDPSSRYEIVTVTPGYPSVIWPDLPTSSFPGLIAGPLVAERFGLVVGAHVPVTTASYPDPPRSYQVAAVATDSTRQDGHERRLYDVQPPQGDTAECLVEAEPGATTAVARALLGFWPAQAEAAVIPYLGDAMGLQPQQELDLSPTRWLWALAAALLAALSLTGVWSRRMDFALYRLLGTGTGHVSVMIGLEALVLIILPAQAGAAAALVALGVADPHVLTSPVVADLTLIRQMQFLAALMLLPLCSVALIRRVNVVDVLKGA